MTTLTARNDYKKAQGTDHMDDYLVTDLGLTLDDIDTNTARCNWVATTAPGVGDDEDDGYSVGSIWYDTILGYYYFCKSAAAGAAVWTTQGIRTLSYILSNGGNVIDTGVAGEIIAEFGGVIRQVTLIGSPTGSIVIDIWKCTYANYGAAHPVDADSICSATPPTLTSEYKSKNSTLTSWITAIAAGDILRFNVDSCASVTRCTLSIVLEAR